MMGNIFRNVKKEVHQLLEEFDYNNLSKPEKEVVDKIAREYKSVRNSLKEDYGYWLSKDDAKAYAGEIALYNVLYDYIDNKTVENEQKIDFLLNKIDVDVNLTLYNRYMVYYENTLKLAIKAKDHDLIEKLIEKGAKTNDGRDLKYFEENNINYGSNEKNEMEL